MNTILPFIHQALLGVGVLSLAACALVALTWGWIEPQLLHWLERRRHQREVSLLRKGLRRQR